MGKNQMDQTNDEFHELLFGVRRSVRYHTRRRAFYDRFNLFVNALALIMGSATVYGVLQDQAQKIAIVAAMLVTVFSSINLVVGSSSKARLHHDLCRRFIELEKRMAACTEHSPSSVASFNEERLDIEAEEPPVLRVLDAMCHNELARAMGYGSEEFAKITFWQRLLANFMDFREHTIKIG